MHGVTTLPLKPRENRVLYAENKKNNKTHVILNFKNKKHKITGNTGNMLIKSSKYAGLKRYPTCGNGVVTKIQKRLQRVMCITYRR